MDRVEIKAPRRYLDHLAWVIPTAIALLGIILDHLDLATSLFSKIWTLFFVNIWYIWVVAAGYGLYRFVRLIQNLHNLTNNVLPTLMTADAENQVKTLKLIERESASRVSADDSLSDRINSLDTKLREDLKRGLAELEKELSELVRKETRERTDGVNAHRHQHELDFERMNRIEASLPQQIYGRVNDLEKTLSAQIAALKNRLDKVESPTPPPESREGLIQSASRTHSPLESLIDAAVKSKEKP